MNNLKLIICFIIPLLHQVNGFGQLNNNISFESKIDTTPIINAEALYPFFNKVSNRNQELVRIIHWGDSHIQMGYMSEIMRIGIDSLYGLNGFGTVFPYKAANYNPNHSFTKIKRGKWIGGNIMKDTLSQSSGFMGFWVKTFDTSANIQFGISKTAIFQEGHTHVKIFHTSDTNTNFEFTGMNLKLDSSAVFKPVFLNSYKTSIEQNWSVTELIFEQSIDIIEINISNNLTNTGVNIHGAIFEQSWEKGITYNNCGVGGAQLKHLSQNSSIPVQQLKVLNPQLIIISFGSNESYTTQFDNIQYRNSINNLIEEIKIYLPNTSVLFTGPPDTRSKNRYPRNTNAICSILKELSIEKGFAYWDLRTAMGGDGSIINWLSKGAASADKLHFTKKGYALHGKWLIDAINKEYVKYLKMAKHEK
jgi:lysophospholipase L1-like esterase